ncbi:MAG: biotin synthase BioB [Kiritimatiellae bacterium]|nr:biotin synthase BioB [Kiritimatiellia bacterium]
MDNSIFNQIAQSVISGGEVSPETITACLKSGNHEALWEAAHQVTEHFKPARFDFCAIINARCGRCSENCKWCAQSAHWKTDCDCHGWVGTDECVKAAKAAEANGVGRIGLVTSGRGQSPAELDEICSALEAMRRNTKLHLCGSLGLVGPDALRRLRDAGLERLHCNLETAPSHFDDLCTTHTMAEKLETIRAARELGMEICCGGIIGMGESDEQLVEFAFALKSIAPDSIPVNVLDPIEGTPLGKSQFLNTERILDSIAVLRLVNPKTPLRFAGGRRRLSDRDAARAIYVGITSGIQGPLLTTPGSDYDDDRQLAKDAGYDTLQGLR